MTTKRCELASGRICYETTPGHCPEDCKAFTLKMKKMDEEQHWESYRRVYQLENKEPRPVDRRILGLTQI